MAKKIGILILVIFISIILASIYGFLHNQISYSISTEYFTEFKFLQFGGVKFSIDFPRYSAGLIGIASTWWFGLIIGLIIGIVGFLQPTTKIMWKSSYGAIIRTLGIAIGIGIVGILVGKFIISNLNANWNLPADLTDRKSFLTAGTMHNFSYLGGIIGLIYGIIYQLKIKKASAQQCITAITADSTTSESTRNC
ncbi:hypothetical protein INR76_06180 [Marixanthomonas sp. SCSIO 43207]|uniref:hypothetical protein n=1 Tax=Marixanthomonas sp. SCSIO 43207 TaxID=2779360 RepID=UPI001CA8DC60|nr:hypothetical protein [Marixanthomonas sp. SCSIO 43207]UAB82346.1 hypothetical protein INR76_06180 [Marixanthomonas sp. SCSIO 43207]